MRAIAGILIMLITIVVYLRVRASKRKEREVESAQEAGEAKSVKREAHVK